MFDPVDQLEYIYSTATISLLIIFSRLRVWKLRITKVTVLLACVCIFFVIDHFSDGWSWDQISNRTFAATLCTIYAGYSLIELPRIIFGLKDSKPQFYDLLGLPLFLSVYHLVVTVSRGQEVDSAYYALIVISLLIYLIQIVLIYRERNAADSTFKHDN